MITSAARDKGSTKASKAGMVTLFITSLLLVALASYLIRRCRQSTQASKSDARPLSPPHFNGLFGERAAPDPPTQLIDGANNRAQSERADLLRRAAAGEKNVLLDAHQSGDCRLYEEVFSVLVESADSDEKLFALAAYLSAREPSLRGSARLAEKYLASWERNPHRSSAAEALHVAALSNDAVVYQLAMETVFRCWRENRLPHMTAEDLLSLIGGEYWLLSSDVRASGAGFVLKRELTLIRRQLAVQSRAR